MQRLKKKKRAIASFSPCRESQSLRLSDIPCWGPTEFRHGRDIASSSDGGLEGSSTGISLQKSVDLHSLIHRVSVDHPSVQNVACVALIG